MDQSTSKGAEVLVSRTIKTDNKKASPKPRDRHSPQDNPDEREIDVEQKKG